MTLTALAVFTVPDTPTYTTINKGQYKELLY